MRVVIHVQHLLGTGHLVRMRQLAQSLSERGASVTLISGGMPLNSPSGHVFETVQLDPVKTAEGDFTTLLGKNGELFDEKRKRQRASQLLHEVQSRRPDIVLIETWPFGRRQLEFEILPMLDALALQDRPPLVVSSIRDVLQARKPKRRMETLKNLRKFFDLVLVHGDGSVAPLAASFEDAADISCPFVHTGYIADPAPADTGKISDADGAAVLVSAGGGAAGQRLIEAALAAALDDLRPWRLLAGAAPDSVWLDSLRNQIGNADRVSVETNRPDFRQLLANCLVSISQFGYNTALDLIQAGCPAVVIPYVGNGETEQSLRARLFAERGLVDVVAEHELTPQNLLAAVDRVLKQPLTAPRLALDLNGADNAAKELLRAGMSR